MTPIWLWLLLVALLTHWRVCRGSLAVLLATLIGGLSGLVWFDWLGGIRTDFVPFTLLALLLSAALVSTLVGLPFYWHRRQRPVPPFPFCFPPFSWPMLAGGALALLPSVVGTWLAMDTRPLPPMLSDAVSALVQFCLLQLLLLVVLTGWLKLWFTLFANLTGSWQAPRPRQAFWLGLSLTAGCVLGVWLMGQLVPPVWNQGLHRLSLALDLNWVFFLPALAGYAYARRYPSPPPVVEPAGMTRPLLGARQHLRWRLKQAAALQLAWMLAFSMPTYHQPRLAWDLVLALALFWGGVSACRRPLAADTPRARYWRDQLPLGYVWLFLACVWLLHRLF